MNKIIDKYLKINYCGQKLGNKHFPEKGLINVIGFELSFILIGLTIGVLFPILGYEKPIIGTIIGGVMIAILRFGYDSKIESSIDFTSLEKYYDEQTRFKRIWFFILSLLIFIFSFSFIIIIPKFIFLLI